MGKRLYVGNIPYQTEEAQLRALFEQDGRQVEEVKIVTDRETGRPRGFAFVEMANDADAQTAVEALNGKPFGGRPLTVEAGTVRVADALDMAKGRSRIPFERGRVSIHSLSAAAIESVHITDGERYPIHIEIAMNNSSGVYQVDELLKAKLRGSGLEPYVEVVARIETEAEKSLIPLYRLQL